MVGDDLCEQPGRLSTPHHAALAGHNSTVNKKGHGRATAVVYLIDCRPLSVVCVCVSPRLRTVCGTKAVQLQILCCSCLALCTWQPVHGCGLQRDKVSHTATAQTAGCAFKTARLVEGGGFYLQQSRVVGWPVWSGLGGTGSLGVKRQNRVSALSPCVPYASTKTWCVCELSDLQPSCCWALCDSAVAT